MTPRCSTPLASLGLLLAFSALATPMAAQAASLNPNSTPDTTTVNYRLVSSTSLPAPDASIQAPQVVALVLPAGGVVPPTQADGSQGSPLTVLPDSHGFDASHLVVALKDGTSSSGAKEQMFGLFFFGEGLQPGGVLHFALSVDKSLASNPPVLASQTPGISIVPDTPTDPPSSGTGGTNNPPQDTNQIPEPLSLLLWSAAAVGVAARHRRSRRPQAA